MSSMVGEGEIMKIEKEDVYDMSVVKPKFKSDFLGEKEKNRMSRR